MGNRTKGKRTERRCVLDVGGARQASRKSSKARRARWGPHLSADAVVQTTPGSDAHLLAFGASGTAGAPACSRQKANERDELESAEQSSGETKGESSGRKQTRSGATSETGVTGNRDEEGREGKRREKGEGGRGEARSTCRERSAAAGRVAKMQAVQPGTEEKGGGLDARWKGKTCRERGREMPSRMQGEHEVGLGRLPPSSALETTCKPPGKAALGVGKEGEREGGGKRAGMTTPKQENGGDEG